MEKSNLHLRLSPKLKQELVDMCKEREMGISDHVRDLIANSVRNYKRTGKKVTEKEDN
jgi:hypothetical protein